MRWTLSIVAVLVTSTGVFADAPLKPPSRVVVWSANKRFVAVADPAKDSVAVYRVEGRERTQLWSIEGWERWFDLSDDGDHLVVGYSGLNLVSLDYRPEWTMLSFYARGRVLRIWSLGALVPDLGKLERTASHYYWGHAVGFNAKGLYEVEVVGRGTLQFDVRTGRLVP